MRTLSRILPTLTILAVTACGPTNSTPDAGESTPDAGDTTPDAGDVSGDCDGAARSAAFTPGLGNAIDLTATLAAGTKAAPAAYTLSQDGTLTLCGTFAITLTIDAAVTVTGLPRATIDNATAPMFIVNEGKSLLAGDLSLVNDGATMVDVDKGTFQGTGLTVSTRLTENNNSTVVVLRGGTVNATLRNSTFTNIAILSMTSANDSVLDGTLTLDQVTVDGFRNFAIQGHPGTLVVTSSTFKNGLGVAVQGGDTMTVTDTTFANVSPAIRLNGGRLTATGCTSTGSGFLYTEGGATATVDDTSVTGPSKDNFPFVWARSSDAITLTNSTFTGQRQNIATVWAQDTKAVTVTGCTFTDNETGVGGAIEVSAEPAVTPVVTITGSTFTNNRCTATESWQGGGAIDVVRGRLTVASSAFTGNQAAYGGAIRVNTNTDPLTITDTLFSQNAATKDGGGVHAYAGSTTFTSVAFTSNTAGASGGGLFLSSGGATDFNDVTFTSNTATTSGGGAQLSGQGLDFRNSTFNKNSAGTFGGAVGTSARVEFVSTTFGDAANENSPLDYGNGNSANGVWAGVDLDGLVADKVCEDAQCLDVL